MKRFFPLLFTLLSIVICKGQQKILVSEGSFKIAALSEEKLYFGFAENDKIVFSFEVAKGKEINQVEVLEYPSSSRYTDFKVSKTENRTITVNNEGVFCFRFYNNKLGKRVCNYSIYRIPANSETHNFNTTVTWITKSDTTWNTYTKNVVIGYDTTYVKKTKKVAISSEKIEEILFDKTERVHSTTNSNGNKSWVNFTLPHNSQTPYETRTVIAWAYWVGVGEEANVAWNNNVSAISKLASSIAKVTYGPLGALSVGVLSQLVTPKTGEDVFYALTDQQNKNLFMEGNSYYLYDKGKGVAGYKKFTTPSMCKGTYYICLSNDNFVQGINVNVKVSAIIETVKYEDRPDDIPIAIPKTEKQIFSEPKINTYTLPIIQK